MDGFNITKEERDVIRNLSSKKDILIQKSESENSVVVLKRQVHFTRMNEMFSDMSKFRNIDIKFEKKNYYDIKLLSYYDYAESPQHKLFTVHIVKILFQMC